MPIYEYLCSSCGVRKEHLQKVSDAKLTVCPECGKETYEKQLTAAGFQLKGSGWYVTDFRNGSSSGKSGDVKDTAKDAPSKDAKDSGSKDAAASSDPAKDSGKSSESGKDSGTKESGTKDSVKKDSGTKDSSGSTAATPAATPSTPTSTGT